MVRIGTAIFGRAKNREERRMRIAFLGGGNMAAALIGGLIAKGTDARSISVVEVSPAARERLGARYPVHIATAPDAAMQRSDVRGARGEAAGREGARSLRSRVQQQARDQHRRRPHAADACRAGSAAIASSCAACPTRRR